MPLPGISYVSPVPTMDPRVSRSESHEVALGQAGAAQALFRTLPSNVQHVVDEGESEREEYDDYQLLFGVFACHDLVDEVLSRRPKDT